MSSFPLQVTFPATEEIDRRHRQRQHKTKDEQRRSRRINMEENMKMGYCKFPLVGHELHRNLHYGHSQPE